MDGFRSGGRKEGRTTGGAMSRAVEHRKGGAARQWQAGRKEEENGKVGGCRMIELAEITPGHARGGGIVISEQP